ncbi:dihydrofolate reductase [Clostridium sp. D2Q-14]|uniref:dihydrofolate reductase n=1 Tax=Anaeromonas gelatinilytica TaxID=2683194 RepID=UPI00193C5D1F|nr:dihydrofolate reductase [Anaeromonas gelatinilytica]MBS4534463.1 dihydrofolate reductase [Anaeromonas gelatinilytica]
MNINMIVALDKNNGIGKNNNLLTHIPEDLKYFKKITHGHVVVMGYNTYMSLPNRPLSNRINIVLTRKDIKLDGAIIVNNIDTLLKTLEDYKDKEIYICGGASIYKQMMPYSNKLFITHIFDEFSADTFFPEIKKEKWNLSSITGDFENIYNKHPHIFTIYTRK